MIPNARSARPIDILLVEDDDDDVRLITKTLKSDPFRSTLHRVRDGVEAMQYLRCERPFLDAIWPDLVLLDLNMPRMDGREVLKECGQDESLKSIPIVVFTSSNDERDILESYNHNANSYVSKPVDLIQFRDVLAALSDYWFCIVSLPTRHA
ncbi:response regulator [bacterium]|nr:response regulator [bacterium]MDB4640706.1 response regulator [Pirellulaceae bacterium]MDB4650685.1 response regulator [Pirellulaceae bacterium]